ncbi:MAG: right-handed parallel beta-helix repeat-containing protein [Bryobacterales bacterium]|nr:right-handed parallel beta-helix repeat-containing protein [Bryobacterales bacterium]
MYWRILVFLIISFTLKAAHYYVDCSAGNDSANGFSPSSAWRSVNAVNATRLLPGDRVFIRRGTVCHGVLAPQGSGAPGQPISVSAYGDGALPVVDARGETVAIRLNNQQYWRISQVAATGSTEFGIFIGASNGVMHDIRLRDVQAWAVHGKLTSKTSGLLVASATGSGFFQDLVIDGATVWDTTQWSGIQVNGAPWTTPLSDRRSEGIVIRNSIAHDVWGDGIVLFQVSGGLIERSAAWNTGMQPSQTIGTPSGIWTWRCNACVVHECESYLADSPGVDGGSFDIDWGNDNNTFESNFGHDSQAYCISVFGAENLTTSDSVIRNNLCVGNGRSPRLARNHGGIHLVTWNGGKLDGVQITGNTVVWTPPVNSPLIRNEASYTGSRPNLVEGNTFLTAMPELVNSAGGLRFRANRYQVGFGTPFWEEMGQRFVGLDAWRAQWQDDSSTLETDLPDPLGGPFEPAEFPERLRNADIDFRLFLGRYTLISILPDGEDARGLAVHLNSAQFQYAAKGLAVVAMLPGIAQQRENTAIDWALRGVTVVPLTTMADSSVAMRRTIPQPRRPWPLSAADGSAATYLLDPDGRLLRSWVVYRPAREIVATLRILFGTPAGIDPEPR